MLASMLEGSDDLDLILLAFALASGSAVVL